MASVNSPLLSNAIRNDVPAINAIIKALAKADPSILSDLESGTKRFYEGTSGWEFQELVNGSWVTRTKFNIDAQSVDGYNTSVDAVASTIVVRDTNGKLKGNLTGKADTAVTADKLASTLTVPAGGTGATTAAAARTNLGVPPTNHASATTTYGIGTGSNHGHVKLSDATNSTSAASAGIAASPKAVKAAYDLANTAKNGSLIVKASNPITSTTDDTTANWASKGAGVYWYSTANCLNNQPSQYGFLINCTNGADIFQIWNTQSGGPMYTRSGNASGWNGSWVKHAAKTVTGLSVSGRTITITYSDGTTGTITTQDTNTTYSAGTGISISTGNVIQNTGVRSVNGATGVVTGLVKSVNGVSADAAGNVALGKSVYLSESWRSGTEWYRKWSDGWIEQGGCVGYGLPTSSLLTKGTITLNKQFSTTDYMVILSHSGGTGNYTANGAMCISVKKESKTLTNFGWNQCGYNDPTISKGIFDWYACGY